MTTDAHDDAGRSGSALERGVGRPGEKRADDGARYFDDRDEQFDDEPQCERCRGDGMDPWCDYLMPCPLCQGEQRP